MSRRPSPSRARRPTITARPSVARAHVRGWRKTQSRKLSLEELVGGRALRLLRDLVGLEPGDFLLQQRDALVELLNREQCQILPDLVRDLFLRPVVVIHRGHRGASALQLARLTRPTGMVVPTHLASAPDEKTMAAEQFRFDDGAAYERHMGTWSRLAGDVFLDWLAPEPDLRWVDVGCGNGAFSERIVERCAPAEVQGIDPSEAQLAFARTRPVARLAKFQQGDAMALPFRDSSFDVATMALVIFFVPDPAKGASEMARVVRPGGTMAAYAWDMFAGGFPLEPIFAELRPMNIALPKAPSEGASRMENLRALWSAAGATDIDTRVIKVHRTFASFDEFWSIAMTSSVGTIIGKMSATDAEGLRSRVRERLPADAAGGITGAAHANAVKGRVTK